MNESSGDARGVFSCQACVGGGPDAEHPVATCCEHGSDGRASSGTPPNGRGRSRGALLTVLAAAMLVLAACGGSDEGSDRSSDDSEAADDAPDATSLPRGASATEVAEAIGCDDVEPDVDTRTVTGGGGFGEPTIEFNLRGGIKALASSSATCFLGSSEVLIFAGDFQGAGRYVDDVIADDPACGRGETWAYLDGGDWLVIASGGSSDDRHEVATTAQAQIGGDIERVSC